MNTRKGSWDFYLILATVAVLFVISLVCIYGMFYFKLAQIHQLDPGAKLAYMNRMNMVISPFLIGLVLLLGICVPKRLLPAVWLNRFCILLAGAGIGVTLLWSVKAALIVVLAASCLLQVVVLVLALMGSEALHFEKSGYWLRVGSSLIHLGVILFVLDLFFHRQPTLHLVLFWVTTGATVLGMIFSFYSPAVSSLMKKMRRMS
ncbi:MAG: hypothetical protein V1706_06405 [Pseudomonadota bacterium]